MKYAKIEDGVLVYATIKNGAIIVDGSMVFCTEDKYPMYGYYPVNDVLENGDPYIDEENKILINPIGEPQSLTDVEAKIASINGQLSNTDPLIMALERLVAANGVTEEDRKIASDRIALRDELGKVVQTDDGDGTAFNPYTWSEGKSVVKDYWYRTPSDYIWQAVKNGVPGNETDAEYFDVVGI